MRIFVLISCVFSILVGCTPDYQVTDTKEKKVIVDSYVQADMLGELDGISEELGGGADSCPYANDGECDEGWLCEPGTDSTDCGGSGDDVDVPIRGWMLILGGMMFLFSPIVFLLTALLGGISVFSNGTLPKLIGKIHLGFFGIMLLLLVIGGSLLSDLAGEIGFSVFSLFGIGFWIGGLSGIGFIYEKS